MAQGIINQPVVEFFSVTDDFGNPILGLDSTSIFTYVYNPSNNEVSDSVDEQLIEVGNGTYKYTFTPDVLGTWYVVLVNSTYFPSGKADQVEVASADFSDISTDVKKILGLCHENYYIDEAYYDDSGNMISARIRIYSDKNSVGTNNNVLETYLVTSEATDCGKFSYWKQVQQ